MIVKRDYLLTIKNVLTGDPVDYCRSNTYSGCLDYLRRNHVYNRLLDDGMLIFEISRYSYD